MTAAHLTTKHPRLTRDEYFAEAVKRYGKDENDWKFRCPSCHNTMTVAQYRTAGKAIGRDADGMIGFSCVGRLMPDPVDMGVEGKGFCNYAGGGLFRINPIEVAAEEGGSWYFDFADDPLVKAAA